MTDDPLSPEEEARLARARVFVTPPAGQDDRLVAALKERGLLRPRRRSLGVLTMVAAAALVVALAWAVVPRTDPGSAPGAPRYVLLLYGGSNPAGAGSGDSRRREYTEWARSIAAAGVAITGEELAEESRAVGSDAPPGVALPRGFFVVGAADLDAAQQIASTCPHLRYGGRIVIQRIL